MVSFFFVLTVVGIPVLWNVVLSCRVMGNNICCHDNKEKPCKQASLEQEIIQSHFALTFSHSV